MSSILELTNLFNDKTTQEHICVVRLVTTSWMDKRGVHIKKSLFFLKRQCKGFNILKEDCQNIGADEVFPRIININNVDDGVYKVVTCDEERDWETNNIEDYNYMLIKAGEVAKQSEANRIKNG